MRSMESHVANLGLCLKASHKLNLCFYTDSDNVFKRASTFKHLGIMYKDNHKIGIAREKVRKILNIFKRAMKRRKGYIRKSKNYKGRARRAIEIIRKVVEENIRPVAVIDYYLKHMTDEHQLKQIDRMVAENVLAFVTERGHKKSNFGLVSFSELRDMGLPSLLHRKRLLQHGHIKSNFFDFRVRKVNRRSVRRPDLADKS